MPLGAAARGRAIEIAVGALDQLSYRLAAICRRARETV